MNGAMGEPSVTSRASRQSGVTLIEMLVALAVIALTLALAATALRLLAHSGERGARLVARHDTLARGIDVLRRDIERMERIVAKRGAVAEFVFRGDEARLAFVALEPSFPSDAGLYVIVYTIRQRPDGAVLTRERAPFQASAADIESLPTEDAVDLIEGPYRIRFLYLDRKGPRERWLGQWASPRSIPDLIALEVSSVGEGGGALPLVVFRPRVDADLGCVKDGGSCTAGADAIPDQGDRN